MGISDAAGPDSFFKILPLTIKNRNIENYDVQASH